MDTIEFYGKEKISRILWKLAPPVILAQLIQALYNIIDSLFIGRFSDSGLTALSIVYPLQLLMIAIAVGTGVGVNTVIAAKLGEGQQKEAREYAGVGTPLAFVLWLLFATISWFIMPAYARMSTGSEEVIRDIIIYGRIVCVFSFGLFLESMWTKVLQACGDMKTPMIAQIVGAVVNIVLDPFLIFGLFGLPRMGVAGAAVATGVGQVLAAAIVLKKGFHHSPAKKVYPHHIAKIFRLGMPNILMQSSYTFYILGLNLILAGFCDQAVTALGLYYKWQTFLFIPLGAMQTCIVPVISFNYASRNIDRCEKTMNAANGFGFALMALGTLAFVAIPGPLLRVFTSDPLAIEIGKVGFPIIGLSFIPLTTSQIYPVFFQAIGYSLKSSALTVIRTVLLFVPLGYLFSRFGLNWFWLAFPVTELITTTVGFIFYRQFREADYVKHKKPSLPELDGVPALQPSKPGVIITIARQHGSSGKQIGKLAAERLGVPFYYKEMIALAAHESGLDAEFISDISKNSPDVLQELYLSSGAVREAILAQKKIIRKIADNGACVIVGRAADAVLKNYDNTIRVFIRAPKDFRVKRIVEVYGDSQREAEKNIRRSDKARSAYYRHITGKRWDDEKNYDLVLDSSAGIDETVKKLVEYVRKYSRIPETVR